MTHPTLEELVAEISDELGITPDTAWDKQLLDAIRKALTTAKEQGAKEERERIKKTLQDYWIEEALIPNNQ